jgi:hypothetical protein
MAEESQQQSFIARARALSQLKERQRNTLLTGLICEAIPFGLAAKSDFFDAAYGDTRGRKYWATYLSEPVPVANLAFVLSVHLPVSAEQLQYQRLEILLALADAAEAGEPWFIGDLAALLAFRQSRKVAELAATKVRPRAAVEWFLVMPKREHLVPDSLCDFLHSSGAPLVAGRPLTETEAERFVARYVDDEIAAGRRPTLIGLEAAARESGMYGGRDHLRAAFHQLVDVRRGRPRKT